MTRLWSDRYAIVARSPRDRGLISTKSRPRSSLPDGPRSSCDRGHQTHLLTGSNGLMYCPILVQNFGDFEKKDISLIIIPNHLIFVSLDSLFHRLSVDSKFIEFRVNWPLNLTSDRALFIFNPNLSVDFQGQLLSKYKSEFNHFGLL